MSSLFSVQMSQPQVQLFINRLKSMQDDLSPGKTTAMELIDHFTIQPRSAYCSLLSIWKERKYIAVLCMQEFTTCVGCLQWSIMTLVIIEAQHDNEEKVYWIIWFNQINNFVLCWSTFWSYLRKEQGNRISLSVTAMQ